MIEGLADGTIDAISSDHMPVDRDAKMQPFGPAQPGASGVDTLLALSLTLVHQGHISMTRMIEALSLAPASILDMTGGTLSPGGAADFILFRPDSSWIVAFRARCVCRAAKWPSTNSFLVAAKSR